MRENRLQIRTHWPIPIDNEYFILLYLEALENYQIKKEQEYGVKRELTEVIFQPSNKVKRNRFCRKMDMGFFDDVLKDLGVPYKIEKVNEKGEEYHVVLKLDKPRSSEEGED